MASIFMSQFIAELPAFTYAFQGEGWKRVGKGHLVLSKEIFQDILFAYISKAKINLFGCKEAEKYRLLSKVQCAK